MNINFFKHLYRGEITKCTFNPENRILEQHLDPELLHGVKIGLNQSCIGRTVWLSLRYASVIFSWFFFRSVC